jgi:hypothetical protein
MKHGNDSLIEMHVIFCHYIVTELHLICLNYFVTKLKFSVYPSAVHLAV